ncbi:uncharacterized protein LOC114338870 isoform X3 [Diabrotica virgifera virgifera]|uniref:Uncharacterized protein n=1 Tax=Diabrotica virgifera virgifera TaxID=50390 RepID=A0ABM5K5P9_DIAVI|nr:uncharacterized protein LOC114338870 isoform X3 [Diabrotica virgifera virgifera]
MDVHCILVCLLFIFKGFTSEQLESNNNYSTLRQRRQSSFKCTLPPQLQNGRWLITEADVRPGDQVEVNSILRLECHEGYQLQPNTPLLVCDTNWEAIKIPTCKKKCPPFYSTVTTQLLCKDKDENTVTCDKAIDGTYLTYECAAYYEIPPGGRNVLYCNNGIWDFPKPICQPKCGKKFNKETIALTWGGNDVKDFEYPWVIALYKNAGGRYRNVCGGTLISRRVVITAAHCVTDDYGNAIGRENFQVAAGKYYNAFGDQRDTKAQYRKISQVIVHKGYRGVSQRYIADLALLITQELFKLDPVVQPVCTDNVNNMFLTNYQMGEVAGWGLTENDKPSDRLRVIRIPYKEGGTCARELPASWEQEYNFLDKICAGRQNESIAVCQGDSGSGLVFQNREDNRYYIHGIVSIAPNLYTASCNNRTNALYTSVIFYYAFIKIEMNKNHMEDCKLPEYPKNGKWYLESDAQKKPGDIVTSNAILQFSCNRKYILSTVSPYHDCESSYNPPVCLLLCPKVSLPSGTDIVCRNFNDQPIQCADVADGGSITFTCPSGFVTDRGTASSTRYCRNGVFSSSPPSCILKTLYKPKVRVPVTPTPPTPEPPNTVAIGNDGIKVVCIYASWRAYSGATPDTFEPSLCTHLIYQFVGLHENGEIRIDESLDIKYKGMGLFKMTTDLKKRNKSLKVLLSVGGSGGTNSSLFRELANNNNKTKAFLSSAAKIIQTYQFDGLDIFWFYPEVDDKERYIRLLEKIKNNFKKQRWLLCVTVRPGLEDAGYDPKKMDGIVDWVNLKTYDFYGSWSSSTGNHNSLYFSSKEYNWEKEHSNIAAAAKNWLNAGLSKEKTVLGVAFYGVSFELKASNETGIHAPVIKGSALGELRYYEICSQYDNFTKVWDDETKTPYLYNGTYWIGYNDPIAIWIKGDYVKKNQFGGAVIYSIDGDDNTRLCGGDKFVLLKHLHGGMGHDLTWLNDN